MILQTFPFIFYRMNVSDRSPFLTVHRSWRFFTLMDVFLLVIFIIRIPGTFISSRFVIKGLKRSKTLRNGHETVRNAQERTGTVKGKERSSRENSNALDRIPKSVHVHASKTKETL